MLIAIIWWGLRRQFPPFIGRNRSAFSWKLVETGWGSVVTVGFVDVEVENLLGNHPSRGPTRIREFPHYGFATRWLARGDKPVVSDYVSYLAEHFSWTPAQIWLKEEVFRKTLLQVKSGQMLPPVVVPYRKQFLIVDGLHRVSAWTALADLNNVDKQVRCLVMFGPARP